MSRLSLSLMLAFAHVHFIAASVQPTPTEEAAIAAMQAPSGCTSCSSQSPQRSPQEVQKDKLRLEQDKILSKLRLQKPPSVHISMKDLPLPLIRRLKAENEELENKAAKLNSFYALSHYTNGFIGDLMEERRKWGDEEESDDPLIAKTKGLYILCQRPRTGTTQTVNCPNSDGRVAGCIEFHLSDELFTRTVTSASLWLFTTLGEDTSANRTLVITEIHRAHAHQAAHQERWITDVTVPSTPDGGWVEVDFTAQVSHWRNHVTKGQNTNRGKRLRISCNGCSNSANAPIAISHNRWPFLEAKLGKKVLSPNQRRSKRSGECSPHLYSNCCLKPFYVNFTEIGWNTWILQPPGYYANYCTGSCRMTATTSYNNIIRNVGNTKEARGEVVDKELVPCCAPTKMMALSLLYAFSPGEIMKKTLENMIVESCGC